MGDQPNPVLNSAKKMPCRYIDDELTRCQIWKFSNLGI
jgi:hypothetical protein